MQIAFHYPHKKNYRKGKIVIRQKIKATLGSKKPGNFQKLNIFNAIAFNYPINK